MTPVALTRRQIAFVDEFCKAPARDRAKQAELVIRAGYSPERAVTTAIELMKNKKILAEIERRTTKALDRSEVRTSRESVEEEFVLIIEQCKAAGAGAWQMQNRVRAAEALGRYHKMFTDKVEHGLDDALMEKLLEGRKRARLPGEPGEPNAT